MFKTIILLAAMLTAGSASAAAGPTVPPDSPLARGEHPRLFVTARDVEQLRKKISTHYAADFQRFINAMDRLYDTAPGEGGLQRNNVVFGATRSFALLYLLDPKTIPGAHASHSRDEYGRKAIELALYIVRKLPDKYREAHHGAVVLSGSQGGLAVLALQVAYDWTHPISTLREKRKIADKLITLWQHRYNSKRPKLENHYAANAHIYAAALSFYGARELGPSYLPRAAEMMRSFDDIFLTRQLGIAARLYEGRSDWHEGDSYSMDGYLGLMILAGASGSALGKNLFAENPWLRYAPYYIYFNIRPVPYKGDYYFTQHNTSKGMKANRYPPSNVMNISAAMLNDIDPDLAGFAAWFCEQSPYGLPVEKYKYYAPEIHDVFYKFLFGTRHVKKKTPQEAGIPLSTFLGLRYVMRSDHGLKDATLIQFTAPKYWYPNGHNEQDIGNINIHRFGPLAVSSVNSKNAGRGVPRVKRHGKAMVYNNILGLGPDPKLSLQLSSFGKYRDLPSDYQDGTVAHIGTVEARLHKSGQFDYINYNYSRAYKSKASLARRALVYLRGQVNNEFVILLDRVKSSQQKYFVLHTVGDITALEKNWFPMGSGHWVSPARKFSVTNRIDQAHGRMIITSVLPKKATFHKFGGKGYEWVLADGSRLNYKGDLGERGIFLLGDHTLQIRSNDGLFLTVMQIGDANTLHTPAAVRELEGPGMTGVELNGKRVVIFSRTEKPLRQLRYSVTGTGFMQHLIVEVVKNRPWRATKDGRKVAEGNTGDAGAISFADMTRTGARYQIIVD